jgi:hypothetical protein
VLDGVDLDIENKNPTGYGAFANQIRTLAASASKQFVFISTSFVVS